MTIHYEFKQSKRDGLWYYRIVAGNAKTMPDGGEGYSTEDNARRAARRIHDAITSGELARP